MSKRRPALNSSQLGFTFEPPVAASQPADLAGLERVIASGVAMGLKDDPRTRPEIAGAMSALLGEDITGFMLDAYASEARENHNISAARFLAFVAVTRRYDLLDHVLRRIGAAALVGEEILCARSGHLRAQIDRLKAELKDIENRAGPIGRCGQ
jgi:hypothetical protein